MAELFANVEVNREPRWPILLSLLGGSFVLHLVLAASIIYIPPLNAALNIAAMVSGSEFVDKPYAKTVFGEEIQIVRLEPRFHYPPGYFAVGLPGMAPTPTPSPDVPKILATVTPTKPVIIQSPSPSPIPSASPSPLIAKSQGPPSAQPEQSAQNAGSGAAADGNTKTAEDKQKEEAQKRLEEAAAAGNVQLPKENELNRQPLKDLASDADKLQKKGELDLSKPFEVTIEAELDATGRLQNPNVTRKSGDKSLAELATGAIAAINDSGLLVYLKGLNDGKPTKVTFLVSQDQDTVVAKLESEVNSEDSAKQQASAFNLMLVFGQKVREGKDEEILMKNTSASSDGKKIVFTFKMPAQALGDMLKKQLASSSATKQG